MNALAESFRGLVVPVSFVDGTEHGKTRHVWVTRELVVVVQSPPVGSAEEIRRMDLKALMSASYPRPARQIYETDDSVTYYLVGTEAA